MSSRQLQADNTVEGIHTQLPVCLVFDFNEVQRFDQQRKRLFVITQVVIAEPFVEHRAIGVIMTIIIVPSIFSAVTIVKQSNFDRSVQTLVERNKVVGRSYIFNYKTVTTTAMVSVSMAQQMAL